jgi:16S rRNA (guanine527-N7)-methyltransferase
MTERFADSLRENAHHYAVALTPGLIERLCAYYALIVRWNPRLHLVAPTAPEEFATRHILESMVAAPYIKQHAAVVDIGSGAGLPIIPCLLARPDIAAKLVEASPRKSVFLKEVISLLQLKERCSIEARRFQETAQPGADCLTARALDQFLESFDELMAWAREIPQYLLFGGDSLRLQIEAANLTFEPVRLPLSERRFLFVVQRPN